jgi:hypothetical protein
MNISYACSWFGMDLQIQTKPPLQLWNKEEEDECHKTRSTITTLIGSGRKNQLATRNVEDNLALSFPRLKQG